MEGILLETARKVASSFGSNWPYLVVGVLTVAGLRSFTDGPAVARFLRRAGSSGIVLANVAAVATPLCSCGTTAVVLAMLGSAIPWGPVAAFMAASPLTSPGELLYTAGLLGWGFALAVLITSLGVGLLAGFGAQLLERRGWLEGQARYPVGRGEWPEVPASSNRWREGLRRLPRELLDTGRFMGVFFLLFSGIGYLVTNLVPPGAVSAIFGKGSVVAVPVAALAGVPLYFGNQASLPLLRALVEGGMSPGAALAFLVTGAGTSVGAVAGALTIARWRVVGLVVGSLLVGALVAGYLFGFLL